VGGNLRVTPSQDLENQPLHGVGVESMTKRHHLIEDTAKGPNIRLLVVGLLLANLWRQIVWSSDGRLGTVISVLENSCNTEITDFNGPILVHKDVLSLEISMQDLPIVNVLDGKRHLDKPVEDLVLTVADFSNLFLVGYFGVQVSPVCIVHDDAEAALIHKRLFVSDDVRMAHRLQDVHLVDGVLTLFTVHLRNVDDLHNVGLSISHRLH
jgi:hypothetical protein